MARPRSVTVLAAVALYSSLAVAEHAERLRSSDTSAEFTFTRIRYGASGRGFGRNAWAHD